MATCTKVRNEHGFHIDEQPVVRWLQDPARGLEITLETIGADGWRCDVAGQILHDATPPESRSETFSEQLLLFARTIPLLVEAMIAGFMAQYAEEMTFEDGIKGDEVDLDPVPTSAGTIAVQIKPHRMVWHPFFIGMPCEEAEVLSPELYVRPADGSALINVEEMPEQKYPGWWVRLSKVPASPGGDTLCLVCQKTPGPLILGRIGGPRYRVTLSREWRPKPGAEPLVAPDVVG